MVEGMGRAERRLEDIGLEPRAIVRGQGDGSQRVLAAPIR